MPKDSSRPKRALGPYNFFVKERRQHYKDNNLAINFSDFSKECSNIWKSMDDTDKSKFQKSVEADKLRYEKEMARYTPEPVQKGGRKKKTKDPNQPKRPLSGFFFFCQKIRPTFRGQDPKASVGELAKKLGAEWQQYSQEEKAPYEDMARKDKKRYEREMEIFKSDGKKGANSAEPIDDDSSNSDDKD
ncbi:high mobility group (HMG)-box containing transcription factor [Oopsacas minuta]|uniref:High mobility group (HMG)-box containing transcription factor n=1 Tax=Oopsacas minuta TaxID=111878 RepID=A0AAV7KKA3_9METZ|nr:high mobility group (HMG)-box containing transcription factor [Oopsacas minuta]